MTVEIVPHRRLRDRLRRPTHIVRVMSPSGVYPDSTIVSADSLFYVGEAICFSVVPYDPEERNNFEFYSEVEWATLREIRLYGSILISTRREESYVAIYPYRHPFYLFLNESLKYKRTQRRIRDALVTHLSTNCRETYPFRGMTAPPAVGGPAYDLRENAIRRDWQCMIETNIDINDHLLIRGLSTLLRAVMVWQHPQFAEEAINTIFISLDASFQIVLRTLETRGYKNASALDAGRFIADVFHEDTPEMRYFETFYDSRVMSLHPKSRFGIFPHAPLFMDDFIDLRDALMEIYANLIGGFIHPDVLEHVKSKQRRSDGRLYGDTLRLKRIRNFNLTQNDRQGRRRFN